mgnify:CR=1 FL=1
MQAYIDGTRVISITESGYIDRPALTLYIGKNNASSDYDYKGYISNLRVNRGTAHYTGASATVPTSPLTGITGSQGMLLCGSNILQDKLVYSNAPRHAITVGGSPKVYPFSPFAPSDSYSAAVNGGSAYFNGTGYTSIAANTDFNILSDGTFTVEYWLYAEEWNGSYADHAGVFNGVSAGWLIYQLGTDIEVYMNGVDMISVARPSLHSWHHIALTRSSGTLPVAGSAPMMPLEKIIFPTRAPKGIGAPCFTPSTCIDRPLRAMVSPKPLITGRACCYGLPFAIIPA